MWRQIVQVKLHESFIELRYCFTSLPQGLDLLSVDRVATVQSTQVTLDGQLSVHHRVLRHQVRLVEVVSVFHVSSSQTCHQRD